MPEIFHSGVTAHLTKRGRYYQLAWRQGETRFRRSTGASTLEEAREIASRILESVSEPTEEPSTAIRLSQALDRIWREYWQGHSSGSQRYKYVLEAVQVLEDPPIDQINYGTLERLQAHWKASGIKGATINRKLTAVRSVLGRAVKHWEILDKAPRTPREKERECRPRVLTPEEIEQVLHHSSSEDWQWLWRFMLFTGCRRGELLHICETSKWRAFEFSAKPARVELVGKGNAFMSKLIRTVPLRSDLTEWLMQRKADGHDTPWDITVMKIRGEWSRIKTAMGLDDDPDFVIHALRHTCATDRCREGMPLRLVQKWLGHRSWKTTEKYINLIDKDLDQWSEFGSF